MQSLRSLVLNSLCIAERTNIKTHRDKIFFKKMQAAASEPLEMPAVFKSAQVQ